MTPSLPVPIQAPLSSLSQGLPHAPSLLLSCAPWSPDWAPLGNLHSWASSDPEAQCHPSSCAQHIPSPGTGSGPATHGHQTSQGVPRGQGPSGSNEWSPDLFWIHLGPQPQHKISGRTPPIRDALGKRKRKRRRGEKALIAGICARQARPSLGGLVRAGLSGQQQEVDEWPAEPGWGASFPQQDPAGSIALWQVGQRAAPMTPFQSPCLVFPRTKDRPHWNRDSGAETKNLGWEALPAGLPARVAAGKSLNQTHI